METDIQIPNQIYNYYYIDRISLNRINLFIRDNQKILDIYIKDNIACKIFCCLVFSAKLIAMYFLMLYFVAAYLANSAITDFSNIRKSKLNLFMGIEKYFLSAITQLPYYLIGYAMYWFFTNPYFWMIFFGTLATAILIMTVVSTICLCRSQPVMLCAYESKRRTNEGMEIEHKFAEKWIDRYDLAPLRGDRISFREKIFIRKEEIVSVKEDEQANLQDVQEI